LSTMDLHKKGQVKVSMYKYVRMLLEDAPEDMTSTAKTPASGHLFMINLECKKLPEKTAHEFHHILAKLLYLCRRTW